MTIARMIPVLAAALALTAGGAWAGSYNAAGGNWSDAASWGGLPVPPTGGPGVHDSIVAFSPGAVLVNDAGASGQIYSAIVNNAGSLQLTGKGLTVRDSLTVSAGATLDLASNSLAVYNNLTFDGGTLARAGGSMTVGSWLTANQGAALTLSAADSCQYLQVSSQDGAGNWSSVTTAGLGNVTRQVQIGGGTLALGADLVLFSELYIGGRNWGRTGEVAMNGHTVSAANITFGWNGAGQVTRSGGEALKAADWINVNEGSQLAMVAADSCQYLQVNGWDGTTWSAASTASTSNVTRQVIVGGGTLTLGADLALFGDLYIGGKNWGRTGDVAMNGHKVSAANINFGWNGAGKITRSAGETLKAADWINVNEGSQLAMIAGDSCQYLQVNGWDGTTWSAASTASTANVTRQVIVGGGTLTLGADLVLFGDLYIGGKNWGRTGDVVMNGHKVSAANINFGWNGAGQVTRSAGETLKAADWINVNEGSQLTMVAGDFCQYLQVNGSDGATWSAVTTASVGNVTRQVIVGGGTLTLGADMDLINDATVGGKNWGRAGVLAMNGHSLSAGNLSFGWNGGGTSDGTGRVYVFSNLSVNESSAAQVRGGTVGNALSIGGSGNSLAVSQAAGQLDGLSLDNVSASALGVAAAGVLSLVFDGGSSSGLDWGFRWLGDHADALTALADDSRLVWSGAPQGVGIWYEETDGYTYVGYFGSGAAFHPGDANKDGVVDLQDFGSLKDNFGVPSGATWAQGDFNGDGATDLQDFGILKEHFGHTDGDSPLAVPEPASAALLALGFLAACRRRRP